MRVRHVSILLFCAICSAQEITLVEKVFSSDVDCEATAECDPENDPRHPQRIAKCQVTVVDEDSTDLTFYFNGQRRNSAADLFCESANNKTICEVSLTVTEMITRDMHGEEIKCVYADEREEIEKESTARLTVLHPPKIVMTGDQRLFKNENLLNCTASGYPTPVIEVHSLEKADVTNLELVEVNDGLSIISKETKWNQLIVCYADNGVKATAQTRQDTIGATYSDLFLPHFFVRYMLIMYFFFFSASALIMLYCYYESVRPDKRFGTKARGGQSTKPLIK
ncbi:unnamed protein product [Oikopleura dioica]|uniref:Ig-like domain-containing protein n=1 Tax=Oikopleura dioica TaxID=34765 RepID=E4YKI1_OIKDI|nr:unnamed protein product [Oikopleura dioica]